MENKEVYILHGSRTPMGSYGGTLSGITAIQLGVSAVKDVLEKSQIDKDRIESIVMGNVLSTGLGQAPARQVSIHSGIPQSVCATTVNKVCASGMKAVQMVYNEIHLGDVQLGIAGGMESMSGVPFYIPGARFGIGYGDGKLLDGLAGDGLTDAYSYKAMGVSGDLTAKKYGISREDQDFYAEISFTRSQKTWASGLFKSEIAPVLVPQKKGEALIMEEDEHYKKANFEKMRLLKPAFSPDGTVTAANASPLSDGASALVLAGKSFCDQNQIQPEFRILAYSEAEQDPDYFTTTPVLATQKVLKKTGLEIKDIDFFEVNEAFSVVPLAYMKLLDIPHQVMNIHGGAVSLGHPLGSSGSRIIVSLMNILRQNKKRLGLAAICNGGGGASALILERV